MSDPVMKEEEAPGVQPQGEAPMSSLINAALTPKEITPKLEETMPNKISSNEEVEEECPKTFPLKLMEVLNNESNADVVTWLPHGKGFIIYKKKRFASDILPKFFKQSKFTSFTRKLNRWGFTRITRGPETGAYYHKFFQKGEPRLAMQMSCLSGKAGTAKSQAGMGTNPIPGVPLGMFTSSGGNQDISGQNQSLIRHQLHQLQLQQMQLQQLQFHQQQQLQAAELFRQAMSNKSGNGDDNANAADASKPADGTPSGTPAPPSNMFPMQLPPGFIMPPMGAFPPGVGAPGADSVTSAPAPQASTEGQDQQQTLSPQGGATFAA